MFTIGNLWWLVVLAVLLVFAVWYSTTCLSHRVVERISAENPQRYNFSFRNGSKRRPKR